MNYPCREKYIDEKMGGNWFIFGNRPDGSVDIANSLGDVLDGVPIEKAQRVIAAQAELMNTIYRELGLEGSKEPAKPNGWVFKKFGLFLQYKSSTTHTGTHESLEWVAKLEYATVFYSLLPYRLRHDEALEGAEKLPVRESRSVVLL